MIEGLSHINDIFSGFELWKFSYWGIGAFGIIGFVLLLIFAPDALRVIVTIVLRIVEDLLSTRIGVAVLTALLVALTVNYMRHSIDDKNFAERTAQFEQQQTERDTKIAADAKAEKEQEVSQLIAKNADLDRQLKDFIDAIPADPPPTTIHGSVPVPVANPFRIGAAACKLRVLAGTARPADCQPPGHKGVPNARKPGTTAGHPAVGRLPPSGAASPVSTP